MSREALMNVRTFLRGGYRDIVVPTTIISGTERIGVWLPESWANFNPMAADAIISDPRPAQPEREAGDPEPSGDSVVSPDAPPLDGDRRSHGSDASGADGTAGQAEAPSGSVPEPSVSGDRVNSRSSVPAHRPHTQALLDRANKAGRS